MELGNFVTDLNGKKCVKCDKDAKFTGVDPKKAWYCQECFVQMVRNKFRSSLSKKKIYKDADARDTLIVFDGTLSGTFLLHQINDALKQITYKRLMVKPTVLVLVSLTEDTEIQMVIKRIQEIKKSVLENVRWVVAHLACSMYDEDFKLKENECNGVEKISDYNQLIASCSVPTYRKELERVLKEKCLQKIACSMGILKCMVPDHADDLGRLAIDQLCLGRGGSISTLVTVTDKRPDFMLIRPLCDISKKELAVYNYLCDIDKHCIHIAQQNNQQKSVQTLTDAFICTLENEKFYSTINTVLSTAAKIHNTSIGKDDSKCSFCNVEVADSVCSTCSAIRECTGDLLTLLF
ncbi:Cytoplasmic tRNA 2-thiolation protein 2 [Caenorhabditis elegans]|uniref:Cytoplasmic tRNA 2-thiolation protein 2 n=1 Tax=Caenorhabditis elegans TaxID=6239 RepID=CTU2_CAEEL|nr:Cytoplasmic tRNA 2-thiolation protein 2 [Caenorhabditis elegans]Q19906.2 RecName: Full=Cytoplasmic tRNA 2-thiolation protein 2; AltName: Full=Thiolation of uridine in tRNA protein 2 [Caenorhabditis elegans]CAA98270.2 Cytoplasmic tRNA 2-thiolation protein 2 [Caenorhabditis elegans]|eukprot:NP_505729.1 Cytoplasmic tRNA 2-thiolation protein 2 [Caenorhabditis elegans]